MSAPQLEPFLRAAERRAVLTVLRSHPQWTLDHLATVLDRGGVRATVLGSLTVGELLDEDLEHELCLDEDGAPLNQRRLALARRVSGSKFDAYVREVLAEADGRRHAASYLRARVGGPRWKLQAALRRLVGAGLVQRCGTTSGTRYWIPTKARA